MEQQQEEVKSKVKVPKKVIKIFYLLLILLQYSLQNSSFLLVDKQEVWNTQMVIEFYQKILYYILLQLDLHSNN